jgi:hypothetical protein
MPDVEYTKIPKAELDAIKSSGAEAWFSDDAHDDDFEESAFIWEDTALFTLSFDSDLSEDEFVFRRVAIPDTSSCLYFLDATLVRGAVTISGIGESSDATAIEMYLRIADYTGETLPDRITVVAERFNPDKSEFLLGWRTVTYYLNDHESFEEHYERCTYITE